MVFVCSVAVALSPRYNRKPTRFSSGCLVLFVLQSPTGCRGHSGVNKKRDLERAIHVSIPNGRAATNSSEKGVEVEFSTLKEVRDDDQETMNECHHRFLAPKKPFEPSLERSQKHCLAVEHSSCYLCPMHRARSDSPWSRRPRVVLLKKSGGS